MALARVTAVVGTQEFFTDRAIRQWIAACTRDGLDIHDHTMTSEGITAHVRAAASPDLFGGTPAVVVRAFENLSEAPAMSLLDLVEESAPTRFLIAYGGPKGSAKAKKRLAHMAGQTVSADVLKGRAVADFVKAEFKSHGKTVDQATISLLIAAIGTDPRGLASAASQLASDIDDRHITSAQAAEYYSGHVEVKGYEIAEAVANRNPALAVASLRFAMQEGGTRAGLMTVAALSTTLNRLSVAKNARGTHGIAEVAAALKIPEWIAKNVVSQSHKWTQTQLAQGIIELAELSVMLKGGYEATGALSEEQKLYQLERCVLSLATVER